MATRTLKSEVAMNLLASARRHRKVLYNRLTTGLPLTDAEMQSLASFVDDVVTSLEAS
jgi:hypothetical protein